ncbi:MAG TPA: tetratricopeptide repeat protein [bacterium]|nr:tetratricopeptide repeat protein [bacterium]
MVRYIKIHTILLSLGVLFASCAYFNTVYNAKTAYNNGYQAYRMREREGVSNVGQSNQYFRDAVTKGKKILAEYGDSKYTDDAYLLIGKSYYFLEEYLSARNHLNRLLTEHPNSEYVQEARLYLGKADFESEEYILATQEIEQLLAECDDPEIKAQAYLTRADLYRVESKPDEMLEAINSAIEISSDNEIKADAAWRTAKWAETEQRYDEAERFYQRAARFTRKPQFDKQIDFQLSQLYRKKGDYPRAREEISLMLASEEFQEFWPELEVERGLLYEFTGDTVSAIEAYQYVTTTHQRTEAAAHAYYLLGELDYYRMRYSDAKASYRQVPRAQRNSRYQDLADEKVTIIDRLEEVRESRETFEKQFSAIYKESAPASASGENPAPDPGEAGKSGNSAILPSMYSWLQVADTLAHKNEYVETLYEEAELYVFDLQKPAMGLALTDTILALAAHQSITAKTHLLRAYTYENIFDQPDRAQQIREQIIQQYPNTLAAKSLLDRPEAMKEKDNLAIDDPVQVNQQYRLADSLMMQGDFSQAVPLLRRIHTNYPETWYGAKSLFALGWVYENRLMNLDSALAVYRQFQQRYPDHNLATEANSKLKSLQRIKVTLENSAEVANSRDSEPEPVEPGRNRTIDPPVDAPIDPQQPSEQQPEGQERLQK